MRKWRRVLQAVPVSAAAVLTAIALTGAAASATSVSFSGTMEGDLHVTPGDSIAVGVRMSQPGGGSATLPNAGVTFGALCPNGTVKQFTVDLAPGPYQLAADGSWGPTNLQGTPDSFQGSKAAPAVCGSG